METTDIVSDIIIRDNVTTIVLTGDLDLYSVPVVRPEIIAAANEFTGKEFRIDLTRVGFLDSAGLALLLALRKIPHVQGRLTISVGADSHPDRVLRLTRIDSFIPLIPEPVPAS